MGVTSTVGVGVGVSSGSGGVGSSGVSSTGSSTIDSSTGSSTGGVGSSTIISVDSEVPSSSAKAGRARKILLLIWRIKEKIEIHARYFLSFFIFRASRTELTDYSIYYINLSSLK